MSILNVVGAKVWGGGEQYVYDMCDELHRRRIPSFVLIDVSNHELQERFEQVAGVLTANLYSYKGFTSVLSIVKQMKENDCRHVYDKDLRAFNVGCMLSYMDYTPRTLEEIMTGAEK